MIKPETFSIQYQKAEDYVKHLLPSRLAAHLYYHNLSHTLDVLQAATNLLMDEGVDTGHNRLILQTAALFHDTGFIHVYNHHEDESCKLAGQVLPGFGYSNEDIEAIQKLIMKTKMAKSPESILEKILCDADLDYLGRDDFDETGTKLFNEWKAIGKVHTEDEWNALQIKFIENHRFWTGTSNLKREPLKQRHLVELKKK